MADYIAVERVWYGIGPNGAEHDIVVRIGVPSLQPGGEWLALVTLAGLEDRVHRISGVDSWQAMSLAMSFAAIRAGHFAQDGWQFFWERGGEQASPFELASEPVAP